MSNLHLQKTRAGVLFHLQITVDMELPVLEVAAGKWEGIRWGESGLPYESDLLVVKMGIPEKTPFPGLRS